MTIQPGFRFNFGNAPGLIPRGGWTFSRGTTGFVTNVLGQMKSIPANHPRYEFDPITGLCRGMLFERGMTNRLVRSRELNVTASGWTHTNITVTADTRAAADGTTALETLAATGTDGEVTQSFTVTAGQPITISGFGAPNASNWARLRLTDGTNSVVCWYNLSTGVTGTNTAGAGTATFYAKDIVNFGGGLYRCGLTILSSTSTTWTAAFGPCAADNTAPANADSIYFGDTQAEESRVMTSFIPTTTGTVTRPTDLLSIDLVNAPWWKSTEGTLGFEIVIGGRKTESLGSVFGGFGDTFNNVLYFAGDRSNSILYMPVRSGGAEVALPNRVLDFTVGARNRFIGTWKASDYAVCANGGAVSTVSSGALPVSPTRLIIGGAPWDANGGASPNDCITQVMYWPMRASSSFMQTWSRI